MGDTFLDISTQEWFSALSIVAFVIVLGLYIQEILKRIKIQDKYNDLLEKHNELKKKHFNQENSKAPTLPHQVVYYAPSKEEKTSFNGDSDKIKDELPQTTVLQKKEKVSCDEQPSAQNNLAKEDNDNREYTYMVEATDGEFKKRSLVQETKSNFRSWQGSNGIRYFEFCGNEKAALDNLSATFDNVCRIEGPTLGVSQIENVSPGVLDNEYKVVQPAVIRLS